MKQSEYTIGTYAQQVRRQPEVVDSPATAVCRAALAKREKDTKLLMELALALKAQFLYYEASEVLSELLMQEPFDVRALCQRGHVYIGLRAYKQAAADFELALRVAPMDYDSLYHIGLCYYLLGDYQTAERYYARCYAAGKTEEDYTAVLDWYWLTLMHLGKTQEANTLLAVVEPDWDCGENEIYFKRLFVYKGISSAEEVLHMARTRSSHEFCTYAYGIAYYMWSVLGERESAKALIAEIAATTGPQWGGFALQAAEVAMSRGTL